MSQSIKYKDSSLTINERVEDLLGRMTINEKIAQLGGYMDGQLLKGDEVDVNHLKNITPDGLGEVVLAGAQMKPANVQNAIINALQKYYIENTRLGIPVIAHIEALSGVLSSGTTNYPSALGQAATWNPEAMETMTDYIREEMMQIGYRQALSPVLDVAREHRWGRVGETYGEDPYLASAMGTAFVLGLQGDITNGAAATGKHFLGYATSERGYNMSSENITERRLYEIYARPFETAVKEADMKSVMNSYGEIDGVPICSSKKILDHMLRDTIGFSGPVVSDYMSVQRLINPYNTVDNLKDGAIACLEAGLDVELPVVAAYNNDLIEAVDKGELDIKYINQSVRRVLTLKFELGLFDNPYAPVVEEANIITENTSKHSKKMAEECLVLLKNEESILPLKKDKKVAVIGPHGNANRPLFGCYTFVGFFDMIQSSMKNGQDVAMEGMDDMQVSDGSMDQMQQLASLDIEDFIKFTYPGIRTLKESIEDYLTTEVAFAKGCSIKGDDESGFEEALKVAKEADIVIMAMGGLYGWGNHCTSGEGCDSSNIGFFGVQEKLVQEVYGVNPNIVLLQYDAKPLSSEWIAEHVPAMMQVWVPGQEGSKAITEALFGEYNPAGRMPMTIPRNVSQLPVYYNPPWGTADEDLGYGGYVDENSKPLFTFGHGLSYTSFEYQSIELSAKEVPSTDSLTFKVAVKNTGDVDGDEVIQVYFKDILASIARPAKELVAFKRVHIPAGESKTVEFIVNMNQLGFYNTEMEFVVEPGKMEIQVGASSSDIRLKEEFTITGDVLDVAGNRSYLAKANLID